jgi:hypothetical protein
MNTTRFYSLYIICLSSIKTAVDSSGKKTAVSSSGIITVVGSSGIKIAVGHVLVS